MLAWRDRLSSLSRLYMSHKWASFVVHSVSVKYAASGDHFSKRIIWRSSHNSKTLASDIPLENHLTFVFKRRRVCSVSVSSQRCVMWVKSMCFNMVDNFNHILKNIVKFRWQFSARRYFFMHDTMCRLTLRSDLFDRSSETRKPSSHGSHCVCACMHECLVTQLSPALCNPMGHSLPGFSIHGIPRQEYWSRLPFSTPSVCTYKHKMNS